MLTAVKSYIWLKQLEKQDKMIIKFYQGTENQMYKNIIIVNTLVMFLVLSLVPTFAILDPDMADSIRVGNLDGTPISVNPGDTINIPIWLNNDEDLFLIYIPIAIADGYIANALGGQFFGIFDPENSPHWDHCFFGANYQNLPVSGYTTYQAILITEYEAPYDWLTFNSDSSWFKILEFTFVLNSDTSIIGDTIQIIQGCNHFENICELVGSEDDFAWNPVFVGGTIEIVEPGYEYLPGDANMSAGIWPPAVIGSDVTYLVNYLGGTAPGCDLDGFYCSGDANGDCQVVGSDVTALMNYTRGLGPISYCEDYPPAWPTSGDLPPGAPDGWPNCDGAVTAKVIPGELNKK
jgi:hypothetical protein